MVYKNGTYTVTVDENGCKTKRSGSTCIPMYPDTVVVNISSEDTVCDYYEILKAIQPLPIGIDVNFSGLSLFDQARKFRSLENELPSLSYGLKVHAKNLHSYWDSWIFPSRLEIIYSRKHYHDILEFKRINNFPIPLLTVQLISGVHTVSDMLLCMNDFNVSVDRKKEDTWNPFSLYVDLARGLYGESEYHTKNIFGSICEMYASLRKEYKLPVYA